MLSNTNKKHLFQLGIENNTSRYKTNNIVNLSTLFGNIKN